MRKYFSKNKVRHPPKYMPDAIRLKFPNPGDEAKFKYRLLNDTLFGLKRTMQGIDPNEGKPKSYIPPRPISIANSNLNAHTGPQANPVMPINDPLQNQIKAENQFGNSQIEQGNQMVKDNMAPQTAGEANNIMVAQENKMNNANGAPPNPFWTTPNYVDPMKKQQNQMNHFAPNPLMPGPGSGIPGM